MTNADTFIDCYKQLEEVVRSSYHLQEADSISAYLKKQEKFKKNREAIQYCQDVRNLLSHKKKIEKNFAVEPSREMIEFIQSLIERIKNRKKCCDIQVGIKDVYWQPLDGSVKNAMRVMRNKLYTHVPILDNDVVIGVFDENSVFNYLADEEIVAIEDDLTFENIKEYISLDDREMETFLFFKASNYVEELETQFYKSFQRGRRIGVVFLTVSGKENEKLQGIITPWDMINVTY